MQIYPSPEDIQQMKQNGDDVKTIAEAEATLHLYQAMMDIQNLIHQAFSEVNLGDGIGLWQAQGIDDYKSEAECLALRDRDEKLDWSKIPTQDLNHCYSSLSFFDAKGMRFHLPAFLIADLRGEWWHDLTFYLCQSYDPLYFGLLNHAQRNAVRAYLKWALSDHEFEFDREIIYQSLNDGDWSR